MYRTYSTYHNPNSYIVTFVRFETSNVKWEEDEDNEREGSNKQVLKNGQLVNSLTVLRGFKEYRVCLSLFLGFYFIISCNLN